MVGVAYAIILQRRELHHQQEEMERNERNREAADKARKDELKGMEAAQHLTATLNAICFLAQIHATKLSAYQLICEM